MQWDVLPRLIRCAYATVPVVLTPQPILTPELTILTLWDAFLVEVTALVPAERQQRVDNYLETIEVTPLTDGGRAIFFGKEKLGAWFWPET